MSMQLDFLNDPATIQLVNPTPLEVAINRATPGQRAYESEIAVKPFYNDGGARKPWSKLDSLERSTWEKNPTPRWKA